MSQQSITYIRQKSKEIAKNVMQTRQECEFLPPQWRAVKWHVAYWSPSGRHLTSDLSLRSYLVQFPAA